MNYLVILALIAIVIIAVIIVFLVAGRTSSSTNYQLNIQTSTSLDNTLLPNISVFILNQPAQTTRIPATLHITSDTAVRIGSTLRVKNNSNINLVIVPDISTTILSGGLANYLQIAPGTTGIYEKIQSNTFIRMS